jgi:hypothetical protein
MRYAVGRDAFILGVGIIMGALGTLLWPTSSFENCMLQKIHDPAQFRLEAAYWLCKGHARKPPS